jgi:hypothetical protein
LQNLPVRLQGSNFFEIGPAQDSFDLLQLEPQLPVEQDLLEGQELCLLVEPVAIRPVIGGLQQARLIVEMKRAHADARHRGQLLDCVSHRFFSAETTLVPAATLQSRGSGKALRYRTVEVASRRIRSWCVERRERTVGMSQKPVVHIARIKIVSRNAPDVIETIRKGAKELISRVCPRSLKLDESAIRSSVPAELDFHRPQSVKGLAVA